MKKLSILALIGVFMITACSPNKEKKYKEITKTDSNGYSYKTVKNDPVGVRIYTLDNGLKVYLSENKDEPRIQTFITVKAGSTYDPKETTGLAHYLEHMMFKGTDQIGTSNWEEEGVLLDEISALYEKHRNTSDEAEKKKIYDKIDSVSIAASKYVVPNEYDKMVSSLGANGTNAYTSNERTVYMNDIPANELEKFLRLESERFSKLVLRLFHTELETVYEEFNMTQDNDFRKAYYALMENLFPNHPYGTQTTIGEAEHLKNPSMVNIHDYWSTYYVPNNMAICMSGDLDYEKAIQLIDKHFGQFEAQEVPEKELPTEDSITSPVIKDVYGPEAEFVYAAFRLNGDNTKDALYAKLIDYMLSNQQAGLIDLNLVQEQKILKGGSFTSFMREYGMHVFNGYPREGQSLEEVRGLLFDQLEKIKKGEFEDWLVEAVINNLKLEEIRKNESNRSRAHTFVTTFANEVPWVDYVKFIDEMEDITKEDIVQFANETYGDDNFVVINKRTGKDSSVVHVEKPDITPIDIERDTQSTYYQQFMELPSEDLEPEFVDFENAIQTAQLPGDIKLSYIPNTSNALFELEYIINVGKHHDRYLPLAVNYLPYLGTDKYSPSALQQEFYKLGVNMKVKTSEDRSVLSIKGLGKSLDEAMKLLEHVIHNAQADSASYAKYVEGILKQRADAKIDKSKVLWHGLFNYGKYGPESPATYILPEDTLRNMDPDELTAIIANLPSYSHQVFYYGNRDMGEVKQLITDNHQLPEEQQPMPSLKVFEEQPTDNNRVLFVDYDMVQTYIVLLAKDQDFDKSLMPEAELYGEYFGRGLSSIVFQEIRESKGLAYSAFSTYSVPDKKEESHYVYAFIATQADKLNESSNAMINLMNDLPRAGKQFDIARESILKKIESDRIIKAGIFRHYLKNQERGIDYDIRKDTYKEMQTITLDEFEQFFSKHISGHEYTFLVMGSKDKVNMKTLNQLGKVETLTLEEIFGY